MKCKLCQCEDIISSSELCSQICSNCGYVISEDFIKAENTFTEIAKIGNQHSSILLTTSKNLGTIIRFFTQIINQLNLPIWFLETAKRYYNCCINKKFTKGRSLIKVACVILYALCKINKTRHLLIDFSDVSKINIYQLGVAYLQFSKLFQLNIPITDPSLFIKRFCSKLRINNVDQVTLTSIKIVQCMKSQWITQGRNPCGICGAAIYIGLKYHGYNVKLEEISSIVRVSVPVIKMRIGEFSQTPYSTLTKTEFDKGDFNNVKIMDPPAYILNKDKHCFNNESKESKKDSSSMQSKGEDCGNIVTKECSFSSINLYENAINNHQQIDEEEDISELKDEEKDNYIYTDKEYDLRKVVWEEKNKEWLEEQNKKEIKYLKKRQRSKLLETLSNANNTHHSYTTPSEAILKTNKFRKIGLNKSFINNLFY